MPGAEQVRFTNTGTEATMLAVKLARHTSGRQVVIKAWDAYHGSYDDLEVGLQGQDELPGRVALARFGELASYEAALARNAGKVAAIIVEPVQYTGVVTPPPDGFLAELRELARREGILFILDDCLMSRLAVGRLDRALRHRAEPDITCLGKWIGGGLPVGAITASRELMAPFDLPGDADTALYHGGSFNGNLLGMVAGQIAVRDLTAAAIERIDAQAERLRVGLDEAAAEHGVADPHAGHRLCVRSVRARRARRRDRLDARRALLHLAAVNHGVYYGTGGEFGLCTAISDEAGRAGERGARAARSPTSRARARRSARPEPSAGRARGRARPRSAASAEQRLARAASRRKPSESSVGAGASYSNPTAPS